MEKNEMIENVRKMMKYADDKVCGVVGERIEIMLEQTPYHYIKFEYRPDNLCCIVEGSWSNTYNALYADYTEEHGGWVGSAKERSYEDTPNYVTRQDMMRCAMLNWERIKRGIDLAIAKERMIDNFTL